MFFVLSGYIIYRTASDSTIPDFVASRVSRIVPLLWICAPITFVVVPEYVARHWWERILYNQSAAVTDLESDNHYLPAIHIELRRTGAAHIGAAAHSDSQRITGLPVAAVGSL